MKNLDFNKVKRIAAMSLTEQGKKLYTYPIVFAFVFVFMGIFLNIDEEFNPCNMLQNSLATMIIMYTIMPMGATMKKFISDDHPNSIMMLPATNLEKYAAMIAAVIVQFLMWFLICLVVCLIVLFVVNSMIMHSDTDILTSCIAGDLSSAFVFISIFMFISSMIGMWKLAGHVSVNRRYAVYVCVVLAFILYFPAFIWLTDLGISVFGKSISAEVFGMTIYPLMISVAALFWGYSLFKDIESDTYR